MKVSPTDEEWLAEHVARSATPGAAGLANGIPGLPSREVQINTTSLSGEAALLEAFGFYNECRRAFGSHGKPVSGEHSLLDFGVGWGRIARFFLREVLPENLFGIDVDPELIAECRQAFGNENFTVCKPMPPTKLEPGSFDFVVGYSVFSHLSEEACTRWMTEFHRLLKPSGMLALTTRGRFFFDYCRSLEPSPTDYYGQALVSMFDDFSEAKAAYDSGRFVHSSKGGVAGGGPRAGDFYGETFIPEAYAANAWKDMFELVAFTDATDGQHPTMFFRSIAG